MDHRAGYNSNWSVNAYMLELSSKWTHQIRFIYNITQLFQYQEESKQICITDRVNWPENVPTRCLSNCSLNILAAPPISRWTDRCWVAIDDKLSIVITSSMQLSQHTVYTVLFWNAYVNIMERSYLHAGYCALEIST